MFVLLDVYFLEKMRKAAWFIAVMLLLVVALFIIAVLCLYSQRRIRNFYSFPMREKHFKRLAYKPVYSTPSDEAISTIKKIDNNNGFLKDYGNEHQKFLQDQLRLLKTTAATSNKS